MRTLSDRIRHTILFEAIALLLAVVFGSWITGQPMETIGALSVMFSILAMVWNFIFNWLFDRWDRKYRKSAPRTFLVRCAHAVLFESFFVVSGMFLVAWWLDTALLYALVLDLGMSAFFLVYAFVYNWAYDIVFPIAPAQEVA